VPVCRQLPTVTGPRSSGGGFGLVDAAGVPTLRGQVVSFFSQGDGLAIAAGLEDARYPLDEMIYDLANLECGISFLRRGKPLGRAAGDRMSSCIRPAIHFRLSGNGVPPKYGAGADQVVAGVHKNPLNKHGWVTDLLGAGDIDRIIIEWRSLLRQIAHAPELDWPRWRALQAMARAF